MHSPRVTLSSVGLEHPPSPLPLLHLVQCSAREPWPRGRAELLCGLSLLVTPFTEGVSDEKCCQTSCCSGTQEAQMSLNWVENSFLPISDCLIGKSSSLYSGHWLGGVGGCQCMQWNPRLRGSLWVGFVYLCISSVRFAFSTKTGRCPGSPKVLGSPLVGQRWAQRLQPDFGRRSGPGAARAALAEGGKLAGCPGALRGPERRSVGAALTAPPQTPLAFIEMQIPVGSLLSRSAATNNQTHVACGIHRGTFFILTGCFFQCFGSELC